MAAQHTHTAAAHAPTGACAALPGAASAGAASLAALGWRARAPRRGPRLARLVAAEEARCLRAVKHRRLLASGSAKASWLLACSRPGPADPGAGAAGPRCPGGTVGYLRLRCGAAGFVPWLRQSVTGVEDRRIARSRNLVCICEAFVLARRFWQFHSLYEHSSCRWAMESEMAISERLEESGAGEAGFDVFGEHQSWWASCAEMHPDSFRNVFVEIRHSQNLCSKWAFLFNYQLTFSCEALTQFTAVWVKPCRYLHSEKAVQIHCARWLQKFLFNIESITSEICWACVLPLWFFPLWINIACTTTVRKRENFRFLKNFSWHLWH